MPLSTVAMIKLILYHGERGKNKFLETKGNKRPRVNQLRVRRGYNRGAVTTDAAAPLLGTKAVLPLYFKYRGNYRGTLLYRW